MSEKQKVTGVVEKISTGQLFMKSAELLATHPNEFRDYFGPVPRPVAELKKIQAAAKAAEAAALAKPTVPPVVLAQQQQAQADAEAAKAAAEAAEAAAAAQADAIRKNAAAAKGAVEAIAKAPITATDIDGMDENKLGDLIAAAKLEPPASIRKVATLRQWLKKRLGLV